MHLAYLDESHDKSEYWIAGLIVPALRAQALEFALDAVVAKAESAYPALAKFDNKPIELHGHALAQGTDDWAPMSNMLRARLGIYEEALSTIATVEHAAIVRTGVDRKRQAARYGEHADHPHEWALKFALERTHEVVKQRNGTSQPLCVRVPGIWRYIAMYRRWRKNFGEKRDRKASGQEWRAILDADRPPPG